MNQRRSVATDPFVYHDSIVETQPIPFYPNRPRVRPQLRQPDQFPLIVTGMRASSGGGIPAPWLLDLRQIRIDRWKMQSGFRPHVVAERTATP